MNSYYVAVIGSGPGGYVAAIRCAQLGLKTGLATNFADSSFDFVVEATGNNAGFIQSLRLVRPLGTLILKSTFHGNANLDLTKLVVDEITVIGMRYHLGASLLEHSDHARVDQVHTAFLFHDYPWQEFSAYMNTLCKFPEFLDIFAA